MSTRASNPFTLGVASGNPKEDSVVLWTRLAPDPLYGGGMGTAGDVEVPLEIATDSSFTNVVRRTRAVAEARYAHSVHHVVTDLRKAPQIPNLAVPLEPEHDPLLRHLPTRIPTHVVSKQSCACTEPLRPREPTVRVGVRCPNMGSIGALSPFARESRPPALCGERL